MTDERSNSGSERGEVKITINGKTHLVRPGVHTVVEIKKIGSVPLADVLEQVIRGKMTPLPDDGKVEIKGGEVFVSHPRDSGSS